jgi:hypothetical protein
VDRIVADLPASENPYVAEAVVKTATALPVEHYPAVHQRVRQAIADADSLTMVWEAGPELVARLVAAGQLEHALEVARSLLVPEPDPNNKWYAAEVGTDLPAEPRGRVDRFEYGPLVRACLNALIDARPRLAVVELFCELLREAVILSRREEQRGRSSDQSSIWRRPRLEGEPSGPGEVRQALVTVTRDLVTRTASECPDEFEDVITHLVGQPELIFRRLTLFALSQAPSPSNLGAGFLLDRDLFSEPGLEREYGELVQRHYPELSVDDQAQILGWIGEGPDTTQWPTEHSDEQLASLVERWQLERLWPIQTHLTGRWAARFAELRAAHGAPAEPGPIRSQWGQRSPLEPGQFEDISNEELLEFLRTWSPSGRFNEPTRAGLADVLRTAISREPDRHSGALPGFVALDPTYVRAAINGFTEAIKAGRRIPWNELWPVVDHVLDQPVDIEGEKKWSFGADPDFSWARQGIVDLVRQGMSNAGSGLDHTDRERVLSAIDALCSGHDPILKALVDAVDDDLAEVAARNSIRGPAHDALVDYAW